MLVKFENPVLFSRAVDLISELVTEVRLKVNEFGMSITAMDPANISLVGCKIPRSAFVHFEADQEVLGVNLDNLKRVLKRCGSKSSLTMKKNENVLEIEIHDRVKRNFSLGLIDVEGEDIDFNSKVERMSFASEVKIDSIDLVNAIEDCAVVAESCSFDVEENFVIEAKGLNSSRVEFSGEEVEINSNQNCKARYSLEYLTKFIKGAKLVDKIVLNLAQDHPLRMNISAEHLELSFILAPRVETEE